MLNAKARQTALQEYQDALRRHDFNFEYADDYRSWSKGHASLQHITALARDVDPNFEIYKFFAVNRKMPE